MSSENEINKRHFNIVCTPYCYPLRQNKVSIHINGLKSVMEDRNV